MSQFLFTFHQALTHLWRHLFGDFFGIKGRGPFDSNKAKLKKQIGNIIHLKQRWIFLACNLRFCAWS
jgi:hypothetical protein